MVNPIMVSVLIVTYNHKKYIAECLNHVLSQKRNFRIEVLIHDDASTDGAQEIIKEYQRRYPDIIKPILQVENQYSKGKINITGIFNLPRAIGKYVAVLDGDDYWCDENKMQKQVDYMEAHPDVMLSFHAAKVIREDGGIVNEKLMTPYDHSRELTGSELVDKASGAAFGSFLIRREILEPLPKYYYDCPVGDRPLELIAASHGKAYYFKEAMSVYRFSIAGSWTASQLSGDYEEKQRIYAEKMRKTYEEFDRETQGRFHEEAENAANRLTFLTEVNLRNYPMIYADENRKYYKELSMRDRGFIRFQHLFPGLYKTLSERSKKDK